MSSYLVAVEKKHTVVDIFINISKEIHLLIGCRVFFGLDSSIIRFGFIHREESYIYQKCNDTDKTIIGFK